MTGPHGPPATKERLSTCGISPQLLFVRRSCCKMGPRNDYISASIAAKGRLPLRFLLIRECDLNLRKGPRRAPRSSKMS